MVKAKKERLKESEGEAETNAEYETESEGMQKKPVENVDGKLVKKEPVRTYKEGESEPEEKPAMTKESEGMADDVPDEEDGQEEEDDDDEIKAKKKKTVKDLGLAENEQESAEDSQTDEHTTTTDSVINTRQNVFVPSSGIEVARVQETPMGVVPAGIKKAARADLMKSPLFISITKQMDSMQEALSNKVAALEKSVSDRLKNIKTDVEKIEKFYSGSFYKAASEEVNPEGIQAQSITKQIAEGKVRYTS